MERLTVNEIKRKGFEYLNELNCFDLAIFVYEDKSQSEEIVKQIESIGFKKTYSKYEGRDFEILTITYRK